MYTWLVSNIKVIEICESDKDLIKFVERRVPQKRIKTWSNDNLDEMTYLQFCMHEKIV